MSKIHRLKYGKMHYELNGLNRLTALLSYCVKFEAYRAVQGIIEVCLYKNLFYLRKGLNDSYGKREVRIFWRESNKWMTDDQRRRVRRFLKKRGLLSRDEG